MKHRRYKPAPPRPRYHPREQLILNRALPPVLSGSPVAVLDVRQVQKGEYRYQVQPVEYAGPPVWASEEDLDPPLGESV